MDHVYNDYFKSTPFSLFLERNIKVDLPLPTLCSTPPSNSRPFVPPHHPHPPPPAQPVIVETLLRGSSNNSTRTSKTDQSDLKPKPSLSPSPSSSLHPLSHETTPTQILSYDDIKIATGEFDNVLFTEGGHKLGQGRLVLSIRDRLTSGRVTEKLLSKYLWMM